VGDEPAKAKITEVRPTLEKAVAAFNERAKTDAKLRDSLTDVDRIIQLDVDGDAVYNFHLANYSIDAVKEGPVEGKNVYITTTKQTLLAIFNGEISPTSATLQKKIRFPPPTKLMDLLLIRKLFAEAG